MASMEQTREGRRQGLARPGWLHVGVVRRCRLGFALVGGLVGLLSGCDRQATEVVVSGRIEVDQVHVGSRLGGRVRKVNAAEGDALAAGAVLVELERSEVEAQQRQAEATVAQATAQLGLLLAGTRAEDIARAEAFVAARQAELRLRRQGFRPEEVREAEAQRAAAQSPLSLAELELARARQLHASKTISEQELDAKRSAYESAKAVADVAEQRLRLLQSGSRPEEIALAEANLQQAQADLLRLHNGPRPEEIAAARAVLDAAAANLSRSRTQVDEVQIRSPAAAVVDTLDLHPGDLVQAGQAVAVLMLQETPWVRCYVPENRLGLVQPGKAVWISVDSFPGQRFAGVVRRLSQQAEFTPRNVQTEEKRAELVFEMKVDIPEEGAGLRAGMYADVHIEAPRQP